MDGLQRKITTAEYECPVCSSPFISPVSRVKYGHKKGCSRECSSLVGPNPAFITTYAPVDYERIATHLKIDLDVHSRYALVELWNIHTDYKLPRTDTQDQNLARLNYEV